MGNIEEAAERVSLLISSPATAQRMGNAGHEKVLKNFLSTRNIRNYLRFFHELLEH